MPEEARLRGHAARRSSPYPLGELPKTLALSIGRDIVHRLAVGVGDITGDDFGTIFAQSIGGEHRASPMGIADVTCDNCAWSVKTVKAQKPFVQKQVRLISGRNSPVYSSSISERFSANWLNLLNDAMIFSYRVLFYLLGRAADEFDGPGRVGMKRRNLQFAEQLAQQRGFLGREFVGGFRRHSGSPPYRV